MPRKSPGKASSQNLNQARWGKTSEDDGGSSTDPLWQPSARDAIGSDERELEEFVEQPGQKAKRQRQAYKKRLGRERIVGVGTAAGAMLQFVTVAPSDRKVEQEVLEAARSCTQRVFRAAIEEIEQEQRAQEAAMERERLRLLKRDSRAREHDEIVSHQRKVSRRVSSVVKADGGMSPITPAAMLSEEASTSEPRKPRKLTPELIARLPHDGARILHDTQLYVYEDMYISRACMYVYALPVLPV